MHFPDFVDCVGGATLETPSSIGKRVIHTRSYYLENKKTPPTLHQRLTHAENSAVALHWVNPPTATLYVPMGIDNGFFDHTSKITSRRAGSCGITWMANDTTE